MPFFAMNVSFSDDVIRQAEARDGQPSLIQQKPTPTCKPEKLLCKEERRLSNAEARNRAFELRKQLIPGSIEVECIHFFEGNLIPSQT